MSPRVVITGLGTIVPKAPNVAAFELMLRQGRSSITYRPEAEAHGLSCHVAGVPEVDEQRLAAITIPAQRRSMNGIMDLATLAAIECWQQAGLPYTPGDDGPMDPHTGMVFGTGIAGVETLCATVAPSVESAQVRQLGAKRVEQTMSSGAAACVSGLLGIGGPVISPSAAGTTGSACLVQALRLLRAGLCRRILAGSAETSNIYTWAMFDAMRVLVRDGNHDPASASRPFSAAAAGFVASGGAGALMLETLESARERGAHIYAELAGGYENCGGQRSGGTMTRQSPEGVERCIRGALVDAAVHPREIDYVNAHSTATMGDRNEIRSIANALSRNGDDFPWVNATKSLIGHCIGGAGSVESVATVLQLHGGFLHPSLNCEAVHSEIAAIDSRIPRRCLEKPLTTALKTSFGFGDVNACLIFRAWPN